MPKRIEFQTEDNLDNSLKKLYNNSNETFANYQKLWNIALKNSNWLNLIFERYLRKK
jgi:hypothetical protein